MNIYLVNEWNTVKYKTGHITRDSLGHKPRKFSIFPSQIFSLPEKKSPQPLSCSFPPTKP